MTTYIEEQNPATPRRSPRAQGSKLSTWFAFVIGSGLTLLFVYVCVARPASEELARMRRRLSTLEQSVWEVAGHRDTALQSTQLLALLGEQKQQLDVARASFQSMQDLHDALQAESDRLREATQVAEQLIAVKQSLLEGGEQLDKATVVVSRALDLHTQLSDSVATVADAERASAGLLALESSLLDHASGVSHARSTLSDLVNMTGTLVDSSEQVEQAASVVSQSLALQMRLSDSLGTLDNACRASDGLLQLEKSLLAHAGDVDNAQSALNDVFSMCLELRNRGTTINVAQTRTEELLGLKDTIIAQTSNLADAVETLELTHELSEQYQLAASAFDRMRLWMVEVVAMEPMLQQARKALQPLTDLGNLRRMNPDQLRKVARAFTESHQTWMASNSEHNGIPEPTLGPEPNMEFSHLDLQLDLSAQAN